MITLSATAAIPARYMNRHAIITGPTGTGKTVTVTRLIHSLVTSGTPVFAPDVKGDIGPGNVTARVPVWAFGADLLARAFELTDIQAGVLEIAFAYADESAYALDTLDDLRALLSTMAQHPESVTHLGHVTRASVGTIQRACLRLAKQGADDLFGPSTLDVGDWIDTPALHILDASRLYHTPRLYGALLLYILRDLATRLPECGDLERPRLVLVFDEAHTIFHEATPALLRSIEATARLIRSKGVGLVWASQSPDDIPVIIRSQCATSIRHTREFGVGRCAFITLDTRGQITPERMVTPDMATLDGLTAPAFTPVASEANAPPLFIVLVGWCILAAIAAAIIGIGAMIWNGLGPTILAVITGFYLATR